MTSTDIMAIIGCITGIIACLISIANLIRELIKDRDRPRLWFEDNRFLKPENPILFKSPDNFKIQKKSVAITKLELTCNSEGDTGNVSSIEESESRIGILNYSDTDLSAKDTFTKDRPLISIFTFKNLGFDAELVTVRKVKVFFFGRVETCYPDSFIGASFGTPVLCGERVKILFGYFFARNDRLNFFPADNYAQSIDERAKQITGSMFDVEMTEPIEKYTKIVIYLKVVSTKGQHFRQRIVVKFANGQYKRDTK